MNNFWLLRSRDSTIASDSTTVLKSFIGKHKWVIKNWRNLIPANAMDQDMQQASLLSDTFAIEVEDDVGVGHETIWQIKAYPKTRHGQKYLAFKLICHNPDLLETGSYYFKTYTKRAPFVTVQQLLTGLSVYKKFDALPLDRASNISTCVSLNYPDRDLVIGVKVTIASKISDPYSPPTPKPRSVNELDLDNISDTPNPYLTVNRFDMPLLTPEMTENTEDSRQEEQVDPVTLQDSSNDVNKMCEQIVNEAISNAVRSKFTETKHQEFIQ